MILDTYFDRIIIISLPGAETRAERALRELREKNLSDTAVVVRGIDGKICAPSAWWQAGGGAWGCMRSHHRAVEDALMDGVEALLVIEDDTVWQTHAAAMVEEFMQGVPGDWGQIYFGGQHRTSMRPQRVGNSASVMRAKSIHRTHAYAISKRCMGKMLQHILYCPDYEEANSPQKPDASRYKAHVDHQLERAHRRGDWPVYCPSWWLAGQGENQSHINGRSMPEKWWQLSWGEAHRRMPIVICDRAPSPEEMKQLHFGRHLDAKDPTVDVGVVGCATAADLLRVMGQVAEEALADQRLPALAVHVEKPLLTQWIADGWIGPVLRLSEDPDLATITDFAVSHAIHHDWFNPRAPRVVISDDPSESTDATAAVHARQRVNQIWIGGEEIPARLAAYTETVRAAFPAHEYKLWTEEDMPALARNAVFPGIVVDRDFPVGMRSDIVRLEILRQFGGIYFDTDFEMLQPDLGALFARPNCFYYGDEKSGRPSNAMMAATAPHHPVVEFYLRRIAPGLEIPADLWETVNLTGPGKLREILNLWVMSWENPEPLMAGAERLGSYYAGGSVAGFWQETWYPYHYTAETWATFDPAKYPSARGAHHWEGGWNRGGE